MSRREDRSRSPTPRPTVTPKKNPPSLPQQQHTQRPQLSAPPPLDLSDEDLFAEDDDVNPGARARAGAASCAGSGTSAAPAPGPAATSGGSAQLRPRPQNVERKRE